MSRYEILRLEREKTLERLQSDELNRAKLLAKLIDIDEELEEIKPKAKSTSTLPRFNRFRRIS